MSNKLILIDGNSILYRAFFALPLLSNDQGIHTNAVYGFTTMLMKIMEEEEPTHVLVAFDAGKTTFRHESYKEYKGGRDKTPTELSEQFPMTRELLNAYNIPHYELDLYEADDIIGTLATEAAEKDWEIKVISGDRDMLQLVSDRITVDVTRKGISEVDSYTPEFLKEKMEVSSDQLIDLKALMGDSSDNIPGVPGVGIKTATRLIKEYGTLEKVYENIDEISGKKLKENLINHKEDAFLSRELVTIHRKSPVTIEINELEYKGYDGDQVLQLFQELDFQSLINRIKPSTDSSTEEQTSIAYEIVEEVSADLFTGTEALFIEMIEENYHEATIEGIAIVNEKDHYYIPTDVALTSDVFKEWAEDETKEKYVYDAKGTTISLLHQDIHLKGITFDLLLASYVLNPAENNQSIPAISRQMGEYSLSSDDEVYGKGARKKVPEEDILATHIIQKTAQIFTLKQEMTEKLKENDQYDLFSNVEMPLALILGEVEHTGVLMDINRLEEMSEELQERLQGIEEEAYDLAGESFNLNSPQQLGKILFEKLELPIIKRTKTGYSTAVDVLEKLEDKHDIIPKILLYRQLKKLESTYVKGLLNVVDSETNKIHTRFNQALTQTGRLSSVEPNLQNIPIRLAEGRKIREAFIPSREDWMIFSADYSQIELRVLAHIAEDQKLIEAFQENLDIHTQTAEDVFHPEDGKVTDTMRDQAKAVNFGIIYGMSDYGLSQNLGITRKEAQQFIDRYFAIYPGVKKYMDEIVQEAKHKGYVTTIMNRRRYLPEINSRNFHRRSFAERTAMNTPIQGSAADIIKKAMIDLYHKLKAEKLQAQILLQVHDELIIEAPKEEIAILKSLVPEVMEQTVELSVPLKVDYTYGKNWFDAD